MDVILPEQTRGQIGMEGHRTGDKYPVLYLLHGMSDDHTIWQRRTSIERYAADYGIAVVMPTTQLGWYTDMHMGFKWWTFISDELPQICHAFFPYMSHRARGHVRRRTVHGRIRRAQVRPARAGQVLRGGVAVGRRRRGGHQPPINPEGPRQTAVLGGCIRTRGQASRAATMTCSPSPSACPRRPS